MPATLRWVAVGMVSAAKCAARAEMRPQEA